MLCFRINTFYKKIKNIYKTSKTVVLTFSYPIKNPAKLIAIAPYGIIRGASSRQKASTEITLLGYGGFSFQPLMQSVIKNSNTGRYANRD